MICQQVTKEIEGIALLPSTRSLSDYEKKGQYSPTLVIIKRETMKSIRNNRTPEKIVPAIILRAI